MDHADSADVHDQERRTLLGDHHRAGSTVVVLLSGCGWVVPVEGAEELDHRWGRRKRAVHPGKVVATAVGWNRRWGKPMVVVRVAQAAASRW